MRSGKSLVRPDYVELAKKYTATELAEHYGLAVGTIGDFAKQTGVYPMRECLRCEDKKAPDQFRRSSSVCITCIDNARASGVKRKCEHCESLVENLEGLVCASCERVRQHVTGQLPHQQTIHGYAGSMGVTEV